MEKLDNGFMLNDDMFGMYAHIRRGYSGEVHIYKVVGVIKSNTYSDVPLTYQTEKESRVHKGGLVDVINVIHCGIDESEVIRVAIKDCEKIEYRGWCGELAKRGITPDTIQEYILFEDECVQNGFTLREVIEARKKRSPSEPYAQSDGDADGYPVWDYYCPDCNRFFDEERPEYCPDCGKKIDWRNVKE